MTEVSCDGHTYARNLARALWKLLDTLPDQRLLHYADAGQTTWYDFAAEIFAHAKAGGLIDREPALTPITTAEFPTPAPRPSYSVLDTTKLDEALTWAAPDWRQGLGLALSRL